MRYPQRIVHQHSQVSIDSSSWELKGLWLHPSLPLSNWLFLTFESFSLISPQSWLFSSCPNMASYHVFLFYSHQWYIFLMSFLGHEHLEGIHVQCLVPCLLLSGRSFMQINVCWRNWWISVFLILFSKKKHLEYLLFNFLLIGRINKIKQQY